MTRILLTAFEPYDRWPENSSWLALVDLTRWYDGTAELTTRRYPVDLGKMSEMLRKDLQSNYDYAIHLGQAPGRGRILFEQIGLNVLGKCEQSIGDFDPLVADGPVAYHSTLPVMSWVSVSSPNLNTR